MLQSWHTYFWAVSLVKCTAIFTYLQGWALARPLKDIHRLLSKTLLCYLGLAILVHCPAGKWTFNPVRSSTLWSRSSSRTPLWNAAFIIYLHFILTSLPHQNILTSSRCHHHASLVDDYYDKLRPISSQCDTWYWGYRVQSVSSHQKFCFSLSESLLGGFY